MPLRPPHHGVRGAAAIAGGRSASADPRQPAAQLVPSELTPRPPPRPTARSPTRATYASPVTDTPTSGGRPDPAGIATVADLVEVGVRALRSLADVGEGVEDELQYVADLVAVYEGRLRQVATDRGAEAVRAEQAEAAAVAVEEASLVTDPHRAIDWLSTLPQVLLFTIGENA